MIQQYLFSQQQQIIEIPLIFSQFINIYLQNMDADYQILPKRGGKSDGSFKNLPRTKFFTNYFHIELDPKKSLLYQYSFSLPEEIPHNSNIYDEVFKKQKHFFKKEFGYLTHKGQIFWGEKLVKIPMTKVGEFRYQETDYSLEYLIRPNRQLSLQDLHVEENRSSLLQVLNINLKQSLRNAKMTELGKVGQFYPKDQHKQEVKQLQDSGLTILRGFKLTLVPLNKGIFLQIDACSRILQSKNLLQMFDSLTKDEIVQQFTQKVVITKYGNYRTFEIQEIDFNLSPLNTFHYTKKGKQISYQEYFKEAYGLKTSNKKQPLLRVIGKFNQVHKEGKIIKTRQYIYLLPEFVSLTGLTKQQRQSFQTMKIISPFTKLSPNQRIESCQGIIKTINNQQNMIVIKQPLKVDGVCLNRPILQYNGQIKADQKGSIRNRGKLLEAKQFSDWVIIYSRNKYPDRDDSDADKSIDILKKAGSTYGIKFSEPSIFPINGNVQNWIQKIKDDVKKNGIPQIIVFLLTNYEEKYYPTLKRFVTNELKCPSQFIKRKTFGNPKKALSCASKIAIQMNVKAGCAPWAVWKSHPYFKGRNLMYGACSVSKGKEGYSLAFVGTINDKCTQVYNNIKMGIKKKQQIPSALLEDIFLDWVKNYQQTNKKLPDLIILYREGLQDSQIKEQLAQSQIPALQAIASKIKRKTNKMPEIVCVVINKRINSRYFCMSSQKFHQNKFVPSLSNPDSGSVILDSLSIDNSYDFHLASQLVIQGSCTPTLFKVAYDTSRMPQQALINFTFEQCFNYYNWEGAVRVPACLQSADKMSKLFGESIKQPMKESQLMKKHFFL